MGRILAKVIVVLILLVAAAVGAAFYLGILDWEDASTKARVGTANTIAGVAGTIGDAAGVGGPARDVKAGAPACRDNLRRIEAAKRVVAGKSAQNIGEVNRDAVIKELKGEMPHCPSGGSYLIGTNEQQVRCSIGGNGTSDTTDDHMVAAF